MRSIFKFLYPTVVLAAICLIVSLALSSTDMITKGRIAKIEAENTNKAMKRVLAADEYNKKTVDDAEYYEAVTDGNIKGYIFTTSANGYGGEVKVMTAILPDKTVKAVEILDVSNETPGLGQNSKKESFYTQFTGKTNGVTAVKSGADGENNEINAVTGATITSRAVTKAVNEALELCEKIGTEMEGTENEK